MHPVFIEQARSSRAQGTVRIISAGLLTCELSYQHLRSYSKKGAPTTQVSQEFIKRIKKLSTQLSQQDSKAGTQVQFTAWGHSIANEIEWKQQTIRSPHHLARILFNAANRIPLPDFLPIQLVHRYESSSSCQARDEVYYGSLAMLEKGIVNCMNANNLPVGAVEVSADFVSFGRRTFKKSNSKSFTLTDLEDANLFILRGDDICDSFPGLEEVPYISGNYMAAADFSRMPELLCPVPAAV